MLKTLYKINNVKTFSNLTKVFNKAMYTQYFLRVQKIPTCLLLGWYSTQGTFPFNSRIDDRL